MASRRCCETIRMHLYNKFDFLIHLNEHREEPIKTPAGDMMNSRDKTHGLQRYMMTPLACVVALITSFPAMARDCPGIYANLTCNYGGSPICTLTGATWECDLTANGGTDPAEGTIAYGYATSYDYVAWGDDTSNQPFCCPMTNSAITTVALLGGPADDVLSFFYLGYNSGYNLDTHTTGIHVNGVINGNGGDDYIDGSGVYSEDYTDYLHGGDDDDTINGWGGKDYLHGDAGNDIMYGGDNDDFMWGGTGIDTMRGGYGDDTMYGENDGDLMSGGPGDDIMHGDSGDDIMCGDDGADTMTGNADTDLVWGGLGVDTKTCGGSAGDRNDDAVTGSCPGAVLTARPDCPSQTP